MLLVYCRNNRQVLARNISVSDGGSLLLSPPSDITAEATGGLPAFSFVASGPPGGIRSPTTGRVVVAMDFIPSTRWERESKELAGELPEVAAQQSTLCRSFAMWSVDGGLHWQHSAPIAVSEPFSTSENQVASADDLRTIITTARVGNTTPATTNNFRAVAISRDGGETFSSFEPTNLPDPTCEGSTIGHSDGNYYMSSGLNKMMGNRSNVSLSLCDAACISAGFKVWTPLLSLNPGPSSYSSLAALDNDTLLLLYEVGGGEDITALSLVTIRLSK